MKRGSSSSIAALWGETLDQNDEHFPSSYLEFTESIVDSCNAELKALKAGLQATIINGKKFTGAVPSSRNYGP